MSRDPLANPAPLIRRVYAYVAYRIGDGADAEDVTSETFERALRYRDRFDPAKGEPISWLIGIARRCIADRGVPDVPRHEPVELPGPGDLEHDTALRVDVSALLARLDEREREIVMLRYGADLTARQIGEVLGMRSNTVQVSLHRTLARLRAELEEPAEPLAHDAL
jgi:RNA polymerase sigma factor (sigma-70 family)